MEKYDHKKIEKKWQEKWEKENLYSALDSSNKDKYYCLVEFPYPSGEGLHVGHVRSYTAMDIISRKKRALGKNVLYPIGWDAFGLPTENYAIKTKTSPQVITKNNTDNFRRQLKSLGLSFDWNREINTTDPEYYRWTQWIFTEMFKEGLAYKKKMLVNWCPKDKCVLANEEVIDGACERCGTKTEKRDKEQWMLAITKYADRLHHDLDEVDYLEKIKIQQRNWIGRSEGSRIFFKLNVPGQDDGKHSVEIFTTRPDTIFGATYLAISPELCEKWINVGWNPKKEVKDYIDEEIAKRKKGDRTIDKNKTGVFTEVYAINPANNEKIPVWVVNYVLGDVGTGAVMAVPAHDERDYEFAEKYGIEIRTVIEPITGTPMPDEENRKSIVALVYNPKNKKILTLNWGKDLGGRLLIGGGIEGNEDVRGTAIREIGEETGYVNLKFISQSEKIHHHYYAHSKKVARNIEATGLYFELVDEDKKETSLEQNEKFKVEWVDASISEKEITDPLHKYIFDKFIKKIAYTGGGVLVNSGGFDGMDSVLAKDKITEKVGGKKETNFKLRDWVFSRQRYWGEPIPMIFCEKDGWVPVTLKDLPVKLPVVEAYEPTDDGESPLSKVESWVNTKCPDCGGNAKRETDTMPNWAGSSWYYLRYIDPKNNESFGDKQKLNYLLPVDWYNGGMEHTTLHLLYSRFWHKFLFDKGFVPTNEPYQKRTSHGIILATDGEKMSKSRGNVVNPDTIVDTYGADTLRVYEMFIGPFDQAVSWNTESIIGPRRFLERIWNLREKVGDYDTNEKLESLIHSSIKKISIDIDEMKFNTSISNLMSMMNILEKEEGISKSFYESLLIILAPFAPHITEELWASLGNKDSIHKESWPKYDENKIKTSSVKIAIQVNGKVRGEIEVNPDLDEEEVKKEALKLELVTKHIEGKDIKKIVYVKGRLLSIVC